MDEAEQYTQDPSSHEEADGTPEAVHLEEDLSEDSEEDHSGVEAQEGASNACP